MLSVTDALKQRTSIRAFKPDSVPETLVRDVLDVARWAPSGGNMQPWRVIAVAGPERDAVIAAAQATLVTLASEEGQRPAYPRNLWEPYRSRRFKNGEDMYALLGIPRDDRAARLRRFADNYSFFGAPIGLFFVIDDRMGYAQWCHMGMFMQSVALAAEERGLSTCMQEAWVRVRVTLAKQLGLAEHEMIVSGMALGYADRTHPVNALRSERADVDEIASFRGF